VDLNESNEAEDEPSADDRPPLGSWNRMYALVLGVLALLTVLFTLFTWAFE